MSDRDHWELRGPVRTADIHRTWRYWKRGSGESATCELTENGDHSIVEFRPDGALFRHWHRNPDGSEITETHEYDPAGRLASVQFEGSSGPTYLRRYEYDPLGRLARHLSRDPEGNERTLESYSCDAEGLKTKTYFVDLAAQLPNTNYSWAVEGSKASYSAPNAAKLTTVYDQADRPRELLFHDANGALVSQVDFSYDESGNLIEEAQTLMVSPFPDLEEKLPLEQLEALRSLLSGYLSQRLHRYDALGHRIETLSSTFGSIGKRRETIEYNPYGDAIAETSEHESREHGFNEEGQTIERPASRQYSDARFLYEYDPRGNWTSKITEVRHDDNSDFSVTSTEQRTLIYFDPI
jgi:hypothetical protein